MANNNKTDENELHETRYTNRKKIQAQPSFL